MGLFLINDSNSIFMYEPIGFDWYRFKEKFDFNHPLNGDVIKRYIENECRNKNNTFLFNDRPISFEFVFKIFRTNEYLYTLRNEWEVYRHILNTDSESESDDDSINTMNKKQIINAEQTF